MNRFEADYNRWVDGKMDDAESRAFEQTLDPELRKDGQRWRRARGDWKKSTACITLPHEDFLNEKIRQEISAPALSPVRSRGSLFPLLWAGAACLIVAALLSAWMLPEAFRARTPEEFLSQVISARTSNPAISAVAFQVPGDRGAVIWIDGSDFIPPDQKVR